MVDWRVVLEFVIVENNDRSCLKSGSNPSQRFFSNTGLKIPESNFYFYTVFLKHTVRYTTVLIFYVLYIF